MKIHAPSQKTDRRRKILNRWFTIPFIALFVLSQLIVLAPSKPAHASVPSGFSEYFIPGSEDQLFRILRDIDNDPCLGNALGGGTCTEAQANQMHSVISVSVASDNVTVFYDHWENGYAGPLSGDETYVRSTGAILTFESSDVFVPRLAGNTCTSTNPNGNTTACYDGRDRLYVVGGAVTVGRATWPEVNGAVFSEAFELYPVKPYLTEYTIPIGEDLGTAPTNYEDFNKTYVMVQSTQANNRIRIDDPTTGLSPDVDVTLGRGDVTELFHNHTGTTITADFPVQVQMIAGQAHSGQYSESRAFTAVPSGLWDTAYYSPVPSFGNNYRTEIFIYNPTSAALSINYQDSSGSNTFSVPALATRSFSSLAGHILPQNSALYLEATDGSTKFWGVGSAATQNTTALENSNYDYGYSLVPASLLSTDYYISWAPGTSDRTANGSPVFISPTADNTTVYIDYSPTTGVADGVADQTFVLDRLQVRKVFDPDNDNSGMHIWSTKPIAVVWGEDPDTAPNGNPYLDVGYISLPLPDAWIDLVLTLDKTVDPASVQSGAGRIATFSLMVDSHEFSVDDVDVVDTLPANWAYVDNSTVITRPDGSQVSGNPADPALAGQILTWNLDQDMIPHQSLTVVFQARTTGTPALGYSLNRATATGTRGTAPDLRTFQARDEAFVFVSELSMTKAATVTGPVQPGDTFGYTITISNTGTTVQQNIVVSDPLPAGVSYVANSSQVTGYQPGASSNYLDRFNNIAFSNSQGGLNWAPNPWSEVGEIDGANAGAVRVLADGANQYVLQVGSRTNDRQAIRQADLSTCLQTTLNLQYRRNSLEADDFYYIEVRRNTSAVWDTLTTLSNGTDAAYVGYSRDISDYASNQTQIRLRSHFVGTSGTDLSYIDNVEIVCRPGQAVTTVPGGPPPNLTTAANLFGLLPGQSMSATFQVRVDQPFPEGQADIFNLASVTSERQQEPLTGSIRHLVNLAGAGDRVWLDTDGDAVQDPGETGLPNVSVNLYRDSDGTPGPSAGDALIDTTVTDRNGNYLFSGVAPGSYYVDIVGGVPGGLSLSSPLTDPSPVFILVTGQTYLEADFGYTNSNSATAILGDFIWNDADGDGVQDPAEAGIGGVTLRLKSAGSDGVFGTIDDVNVDNVTTATDGSYSFTGVTPGEYTIDVTDTGGVLTGFNLTAGPQSNPDPTTPITVRGGEIYSNADFGYQNTALYTLSDRAWYDANRDGDQDPGEPGISGITVDLVRDTNGNGTWDAGEPIIATAITNANGDFAFPDLSNGNYLIAISDNANRVTSYERTTTPATNGLLPRTISGADQSGVNFGYNRRGAIGDTIFSDANNNRVQDSGEPGMPGVNVQLWQDSNGDGVFNNTVDTLVTTQVTDNHGQYLFTGLGRGTFFVSVDNGQASLTSFSPTTLDQQTGGSAPGTQVNVILASNGDSNLMADIGYRNPALYSLGDRVWEDINADGIQDVAEIGLAGVTLALYKDSNDNGRLDADEPLMAADTTDNSGNYSFDGLPNGDYLVVVSEQQGLLNGYRPTAGLHPWPVTVNGAGRNDIDFGFVRRARTGAIGDTVWFDTDRDGAQLVTEPGIPNVLVNLYSTGPDGQIGGSDDLWIASTTTDFSGSYLFTGLAAGAYYIQVDNSSFDPGKPLQGLVSTVLGGNSHGPIALSQGETYLSADLGYRDNSGYSLGDFVWSDADGDGLQDPGEPGIGGVLIELLDSNRQPTGVTTTTSADGHYLFHGLAAGVYQTRLASSNFATGSVLQGYTVTSGPQSPGDVGSLLANLSATSPSVNYLDFGCNLPGLGSLGDQVWMDADLDGNQDTAEPGLAGVTVDLIQDTNGNGVRDTGEPIIASDMTDSNGNYQFNGLRLNDGGGDNDADYLVQVSDYNNLLAGLSPTNSGAVPNPYAAALSSSTPNRLDIDFGYDDPDLGDYIWHDANQNGIQDPEESGIGGVRVLLYHDRDSDGVIDTGQDDLMRTTLTDMNGAYLFAGLPFESFIVKIAASNFAAGGPLEGFSGTQLNQGADDEVDSDANANNEIAVNPLGPKDFTLDAGYYASTGYSIGDLIWNDVSNLGFRDPGETGIAGVTVYLYRDLDGDGQIDQTDPVLGRTITDASGAYAFTNLPAGNYIVRVTDDSNLLVDYQWTNGNNPGTNNYSHPPTLPVTLSGTSVIFADSGYHRSVESPTAIALADFTAAFRPTRVVLQWQTAIELDAIGFNLYRSTSLAADRVLLNTELIPSKAAGGVSGATYEFVDPNVEPGVTYYYWLMFVDISGETVYGPVQVFASRTLFLPFVRK